MPDFLVADVLAGDLLRVSPYGVGRVETGLTQPAAMAPAGQDVLVADFASGRLASLALDLDTSQVVRVNEGRGPRLEEPCAMRMVEGVPWVLGNDSRNLIALDVEEREYGRGRPLRGAHGFDVFEDRIYVAGSPTVWGEGLIQVLDRTTGERLPSLAQYGALEDGTDVVVFHETLWVADFVADQVVRYDLDGAWLGVVADTEDGLDGPVSLRAHRDGLYLLDQQGIWRLSEHGADRVVSLELAFARGLAILD
jgi:hypothetical protein